MSGKRLHELTIVSMVQQLEKYLNPFDSQPASDFKTGEVIEENIIKILPSSIKNPKLETGIKKKKQTPKVINVLKDDKQALVY